jgi:hypothetical protein
MVEDNFVDVAEELADNLALCVVLLRRFAGGENVPNRSQIDNAIVGGMNALERLFATSEFKEALNA